MVVLTSFVTVDLAAAVNVTVTGLATVAAVIHIAAVATAAKYQ